ncbi:MAG: 23S rRNA (guanosine(2251)-2'-O)-methyltransferase RlmB [Clostridia bacterium]|nr:23S rRNA (guanosine(2251)-2'-O)-methyltransferase RlmB [Clostridia bacterium]
MKENNGYNRKFDKQNAKATGEGLHEASDSIIFGRNAVLEALKAGREIDKIFVRDAEYEGSIVVIASLASKNGIPVVRVAKEKLDSLANGGVHQGVCASVSAVVYSSLDDILACASEKGEDPFLVIIDGVEDPHNLGAIIRSAEGSGVHGVIIAKRHNCTVNATVSKASAGAVEHVKICKVPNIAACIEQLKKKGLWIYGTDMNGQNIFDTDLTGPAAFVVGNEGDGISRLVKEKCDFLLSIPMYGRINSFNVSCASAVVFCVAANKRHK